MTPKGEAVIAGRAAPGALVVIHDGGTPIGSATANQRGEWVFLPTAPLSAGPHDLSLSARPAAGGEPIKSEQVVVVMVDEPPPVGMASVAAAAPTAPLVVLSPRVGDAPSRPIQVPGLAAAAAPPPAAVRPSPAASRAPPPSVDAIDYGEKGEVRFSGRAEPGSTVRLYVDNKPIGEVAAAPDRSWQLVPKEDIPAGNYELRVDRLAPDGQVAGRIALPFQRAAAPPPELRDQSVVVQPGNSLWRIARREYGRGIRYSIIYQANLEQIRNPARIYPGQIFAVPR